MFTCCATSSETSKLLRVVNVARRNADGSWHGDMLDGLAFVAAQKKAGAKLKGAKVLQVGAGGAGSAIAIALLDAGIRELVLHDASQLRLAEMVRLLSSRGAARVVAGSPDPTGCDIVVNATPIGHVCERSVASGWRFAQFFNVCGRRCRRTRGHVPPAGRPSRRL
jgi:shikimate dehydrogenase